MAFRGYPDESDVWLYDIDTDTERLWKSALAAGYPPGGGHLYKDPALTGGYLAALADYYWAPTMDVYLLDENMQPIKVIWEDSRNDCISGLDARTDGTAL